MFSFSFRGYTRPKTVSCCSFAHPLVNCELLFPCASVVRAPQEQMPMQIGPSLVVTAITKDVSFMEQRLDSPLIGRLNPGPLKTMKIS